MNQYKKVFKFFIVGQEDKECEWLSYMSKLGYHLQNVNFATYYTFKKGQPKEYTYMIDMKEKDIVDEGEYLLMYEESGIEYIDKSACFYYFRGNRDIETESLIKNEQGRYLNRINSHKKVILLASILNLMIFIGNFINGLNSQNSTLSYASLVNLLCGIFLLFIYLIINKKIKNLKEDGVKSPYKTNVKDWPKLYYLGLVLIVLVIVYGGMSLIHLL